MTPFGSVCMKLSGPTYIDIDSDTSSGSNNIVSICGMKDGKGTSGTGTCTGIWSVNPCDWTSSCSTGWEDVTEGSCTPDCGSQVSHAVDGPICVDKEYRKCDAWCTESGAWCDATNWTSNCDGSWYDDNGFRESVECCTDSDCEVGEECVGSGSSRYCE